MATEVDMQGIDQRPSGKWRVRVQVNGSRKTIATCATLEDAAGIRDAAFVQIAQGSVVLARGMTVEQWAPSWLENHRRIVSRDKSDKGRLEKHIVASSLGPMPIGSITPRHVRDWLKELARRTTDHRWGKRAKTRLSRQTRQHVLNLLKALLNSAVEEELIMVSPAAGVQIKEAARVIPQDWYLSVGEQRAILGAIDGPERHIVAFAIGTGLRKGEQWNLELADLHVDGGDPHVFVRFGSDGKRPKSGKTRKVPLFGLGLDAARAWLAELPAYAPHNPHGLVFPTPMVEGDGTSGHRNYQGGARRGRDSMPSCWTKARQAAPRLKPWWHLLRHTAASSLVAGWWGRKWSLDEVRSFMGHSSVVVTERYAHLADSALRDVAAQTQVRWMQSGPAVVQPPSDQMAQVPEIFGYARQESNLRHSASKAGQKSMVAHTYKALDHVGTTARSLLEKLASGAPDWEAAATDLAASVLARRDVRLALEVGSGAPVTSTKATHLAEAVLESAAQSGTLARRAGRAQ